MDPAVAMPRPAGSCGGGQFEQRRDHQHDAELANLHADVEREERPAERLARQPELAQHVSEPEAVHQPASATQARGSLPSRVSLSAPTNTMLSAMAGSMRLGSSITGSAPQATA
jgi:hypothetical protein